MYVQKNQQKIRKLNKKVQKKENKILTFINHRVKISSERRTREVKKWLLIMPSLEER